MPPPLQSRPQHASAHNPGDYPVLRALQSELAALAHAHALPSKVAEAWQAIAPVSIEGNTGSDVVMKTSTVPDRYLPDEHNEGVPGYRPASDRGKGEHRSQ